MRNIIPKLKSFKPVDAKAHTPPYKIHRYFARRPWNLFEELVRHYAKAGDIVLDPFAGGGVTPYESIKNHVNVVAFDINPLSNYIVKNMFHSIDLSKIEAAFNEVLDYTRELTTQSFTVNCPECGQADDAGWYELAHTVECDACNSQITLIEENKIRNGVYRCPNGKCWNSATGLKVARIPRKSPVYISLRGKCDSCKHNYTFEISPETLDKNRETMTMLKKMVAQKKAALPDEPIPIDWDRQKEDLLSEKGFHTFQDLFTEKNLLTNYLVLDKIKEYKSNKYIYEILRFVFSDSLRSTNIMTFTNASWQGGTPNSWVKHAYWLPAQFCEVNVANSLKKSFQSIRKSIEYNLQLGIDASFVNKFEDLGQKGNILVKTGTVASGKLPDDSVDVVITDPPYGSNVQYLELSHFWYMWNRDLYNQSKLGYAQEAVVNRKQNFKNAKNYQVYEDNLFEVFAECNRVLKHNGRMVMTFNNKDINSWLALLISIFRSGFHFEKGGIAFQDGVSQYKHTAHTKAKNSPYGDFLYEFIKDKTRPQLAASHIDRDELAKHIRARIEEAVRKYNKGMDRNLVLIDLFNEIVPEIETFVHFIQNSEDVYDLYDIFGRSGLEPLYA